MKVSRVWSPVTRWGDFRRRQLAALEESNRIAARGQDDAAAEVASPVDVVTSADAAPGPHPPPVAVASPASPPPEHGPVGAFGPGAPYGAVGRPLNRHSPFYLGFFGAIGALLAIGLWGLVGRLTTTLTLLIVSIFLALALNPLVDALIARGMRRSAAVGVVFAAVLVAFGLIAALVIPPVVVQGTELAHRPRPTSTTSSAAGGCARSTRATTSSTR